MQPQYQAWNFSISAASLLVAVAISLNRSAYLRKRTVLLVLAKLLGFLTLGTLLQPYIALLPRVMAQEATTPPATMLMQLAMISEKVCWWIPGGGCLVPNPGTGLHIGLQEGSRSAQGRESWQRKDLLLGP